MKKLSLVLLLAAFLAPPTARAETIVFDFEDQPATYPGSGPRPGALTSLSLTQAGLTITIDRLGDPGLDRFDIVANVPPGQVKPPSWGLRSLDPFFRNAPDAGPFVVDFSVAISSLTVDAGDYGDDADIVTLMAFSGLGGTGGQPLCVSPVVRQPHGTGPHGRDAVACRVRRMAADAVEVEPEQGVGVEAAPIQPGAGMPGVR